MLYYTLLPMPLLKKGIIFLCFLNAFIAAAQTNNIIKAWRDANPVSPASTISIEEKLKVHSDYLQLAIARDNITQQFYGNIYLYTDNMDRQDYPTATTFLLAAENIARQSGNANWKGFVKLKTGWVASIVQNDFKKAIEEFELGVKLSAQSNDSLCMALCFEMLSAMYSGQKKYDSSQHYFNLAIPVLRESTDISIEAAYSNYSSHLFKQGKFIEALLYNDSAIQLIKKQGNQRKENFLLINRAVFLDNLKLYDSAENILTSCMRIDIQNKWMDNILHGYEELSNNYHARGKDNDAYHYLVKFHDLQDSLSGVSVNLKVANITAAYKNKLDNLAAENALQKRNRVIASVAFLLLLALLFWRMQYSRAKKEQRKNKNSLAELTRILIEKNTQLTAFEEEVNGLKNTLATENTVPEQELPKDESTPEEQTDFEINLYNQRILTADDWAAFKSYFDKAYPGYLRRLRVRYSKLTEAEERLFLFIKLKITNKEAAAILGISADSVKKTRNRLRKRLDMEESIDLDKFIAVF